MSSADKQDDLAESSEASLPVKELMILTGPGSQRSFATSVLGVCHSPLPNRMTHERVLTLQSIRSHPQTPLPEKLLPKLSSSPALLAALTTIIPPRTLLEILVDRLLDSPIDEGARQDDPQGVLTRWGEGVVLVEATVHAFGLELPLILKSSRRSRGMSHLSREHRACLSGWVMALVCPPCMTELVFIMMPKHLTMQAEKRGTDRQFGSEGIDDQIIL